jgi:selenocysteine lyase/cysteine desulfurase
MPEGTSYEERVAWIRGQDIGRRAAVETPFGRRLVCYADLTATGRHLQAVEDWISRARALYANTHTEVSTTGKLMGDLREEARRVIRRGVNAAEDDEVLFVGAGATAAVNKLVGLLGIRVPEPLERRYGLSRQIPTEDRPAILIGPYEHHSNELPWLESVADVVEIGLDADGRIDLAELGRKLHEHRDRRLLIGSFSAASNVTGVLSDVKGIARVLHRAGALAFFDYAAAGPYVPIDMHPPDPEERIDAVVLSPHKFVGGPEASGILVANRRLFLTRVPERPGGGTVDYVAGPRHGDVDYVHRLDEREEGGTPAILGDMRAGLAFLVKEAVGPERILAHERRIVAMATERLARHPAVRVLGPTRADRLAIVSFTIEGLHHDLASALLDHLFGIQNRAGCSCAGPYGHRLLGIDPEVSGRFRKLVQRGLDGIKPGWVRLSLPYYASEEDLEFMLSAVELVASHGLEFVPLYRFNWTDGVWRPLEEPLPVPDPLALDHEQLELGANPVAATEAPTGEQLRETRAAYLAEARRLASELRRRWERSEPRFNPPTGDSELDALVWFRYVHAEGLPEPARP